MRTSAAGILVIMLFAPLAAQAAPKALYGKSVTVSWSENRSQRAVGQEPAFRPVSIAQRFTVYVSTEGNIFKRIFSMTPDGRQSGTKDRVGASGSGATGSSSLQFQGNAMIATASNGGYCMRIQVNFDPGFGSCTAQVIGARQSGSKSVMLPSVASGATIEVESVSAGPASCAIGQGNPFAN